MPSGEHFGEYREPGLVEEPEKVDEMRVVLPVPPQCDIFGL